MTKRLTMITDRYLIEAYEDPFLECLLLAIVTCTVLTDRFP